MERKVYSAINSLYNNSVKIAEFQYVEEQLLQELLLNTDANKINKSSLSEIYRLHQEQNERRKLLNDLLKELDEGGTACFGLLYGHRQKDLIMAMVKNILLEYAEKCNTSIICFTIDDVDIEGKMVKGTVITGEGAREDYIRLPSFIFNITYHTKVSSRRIIKKLRTMSGIQLINPVNNFNQAIIFDMLSSHEPFKDVMLPFGQLSDSTLQEYLGMYEAVFIVPERGMLQYKGILVEKKRQESGDRFRVKYGNEAQLCSLGELYNIIRKITRNRKYSVMKGIEALQWNGSILEGRVYIHKDITGSWSIPSIIAKSDIFSSLLATGKSCDFLRALLDLLPEKLDYIDKRLGCIAVEMCSLLENYIQDLGTCYLDFIFDGQGSPFVMYFGGWEQKDYLCTLREGEFWSIYVKSVLDYLSYVKKAGKR